MALSIHLSISIFLTRSGFFPGKGMGKNPPSHENETKMLIFGRDVRSHKKVVATSSNFSELIGCLFLC